MTFQGTISSVERSTKRKCGNEFSRIKNDASTINPQRLTICFNPYVMFFLDCCFRKMSQLREYVRDLDEISKVHLTKAIEHLPNRVTRDILHMMTSLHGESSPAFIDEIK